MLLLQRVIVDLGADPTALTPSADLEINAGKGIPDVVADPRTTLLESLQAVLVAELADRESWESLIELAEKHGQESPAREFREALKTEEEHLREVRAWVAAGAAP